MTTKKVLITQLTGCSGCLMAILSLEIIKDLMETAEVDFYPFLCDNRKKEYDFAFIEGCAISDERRLIELRSNTEIIVALGSCAVMGGITCLSNQYQSHPLKKYIEVDYEIPGCPPASTFLGRGIINILTGKSIEFQEKPLCYDCKYVGQATETEYIDRLAPDEAPSRCFLKDGVFCMGPITRRGCEAVCIDANVPCEGCMGAPHDQVASIANMLSVIPIKQEIREYDGLYFRFSKFNRK